MERKAKQIIYLAGPMEFIANAGINWRLEYQELLKPLNLECIIPELEEKIITNQAELNVLKVNNPEAYIDIMRKLIDLDLKLLTGVNMVIVKWDGEKMSGTIHEVGKAYELKIPTYLVTTKSFQDIPGWFAACFTKIFTTKYQLISYLTNLKETTKW